MSCLLFHDWYFGSFIESHHGGGWLRICLDCDIVQKQIKNKKGKRKWRTICKPHKLCGHCNRRIRLGEKQ